MKVLSYNDGLLTNQEVYERLQIRRHHRIHDTNKLYAERNWLHSKVIQYLSEKCQNTPEDSLTASRIAFMHALGEKQYDIAEEEVMQIFNLLPQHTVDLHIVIEDCADRFDDDQVDDLLEMISVHLLKQEDGNE